jgi:hypothetical protein
VFRFSELTLIVTDARVVKHIGAALWTDDFEEYAFADLTGLSFERGSVATEVVLEINGRPQRIKTPNEQARKVQQVVEDPVFAFHDVGSLDALNEAVSTADDEDDGGSGQPRAGSDIELGGGIDPLVDPEGESEAGGAGGRTGGADDGSVYTDDPQSTQSGRSGDAEQGRQGRTSQGEAGRGNASQGNAGRGSASQQRPGPDEVAAQLDELTTAVQRQNELLKKQHETIKQLIQELREGR